MKTFLLLVGLFLSLSSNVWAYNCPQVQARDTALVCTETVYNDHTADLTSGTVVTWDDDDTNFSSSGYPYVVPTTTADDPFTAGVVLDNTCRAGALCTIVTHGLATVRIANSTDDTAVDTQIGTTTVSGQAGDYATGANTCMLGTLARYHNGDVAVDNTLASVFINIDCD